ncbi:MAG: porin [Sedimentisphaerales bacterium]
MTKDGMKMFKGIFVSMIVIACSLTAAQAGSGEISDIKSQLSDLEKRTAKLEENQGQEKAATDLRAFWKEGLNLTTEDGSFKLKMGGRFMQDWFWSSESDGIKSMFGEQEDGTETRRARLYTSGSIYDNVKFKLQFDFEGGSANLKDAYLALTDLPFGTIYVGHFKEPFSLEELTSSKYTTFLERALPNTFAPSRNSGIMLHRVASNERMTGAIGLFRDVDNYGEGVGNGGYNVTARVTALPWYRNEGASLLHVGAAFSYRNPNDSYSFASKPEAHLASNFVNTGSIAGDRADLLGLEAAWVDGPLSLQGEYVRADTERFTGSDLGFDSYYIQASYFLTGEHRKYDTEEAAFGRVKPKRNFKYGVAPGAWEAAARISEIDLNDNNITGGKLNDITAGLNWYLNPNTRIMWNYINADRQDAGRANILMMRFQFDF